MQRSQGLSLTLGCFIIIIPEVTYNQGSVIEFDQLFDPKGPMCRFCQKPYTSYLPSDCDDGFCNLDCRWVRLLPNDLSNFQVQKKSCGQLAFVFHCSEAFGVQTSGQSVRRQLVALEKGICQARVSSFLFVLHDMVGLSTI